MAAMATWERGRLEIALEIYALCRINARRTTRNADAAIDALWTAAVDEWKSRGYEAHTLPLCGQAS